MGLGSGGLDGAVSVRRNGERKGFCCDMFRPVRGRIPSWGVREGGVRCWGWGVVSAGLADACRIRGGFDAVVRLSVCWGGDGRLGGTTDGCIAGREPVDAFRVQEDADVDATVFMNDDETVRDGGIDELDISMSMGASPLEPENDGVEVREVLDELEVRRLSTIAFFWLSIISLLRKVLLVIWALSRLRESREISPIWLLDGTRVMPVLARGRWEVSRAFDGVSGLDWIWGMGSLPFIL